MPIYEYECQKCGRTLEAMQKFSDSPLSECPGCSGALRKLISQSSFHLKGSGWYVTDYARKGSSAPEGNKDKVIDGVKAKPADSAEKSAAPPAASTPAGGTSESN